MNRYSALAAKARILSYYNRAPDEAALGKELEPFERAKAEWLKHARVAIAEVEAMGFDDWRATRQTLAARRPNECFECGAVRLSGNLA